jgi:multiple sugar transport system ATP-binding protein
VSTVLSLRHITKKYGDKLALNDVSLDVNEGEFFVVYGPSGAGKTTMLYLIAGLDQADSGEIWLDQRLINALDPDERDVSMTFQSYALYPQLTAFDNIASPLRSKKVHLSKDEVTRRVQQVAKTLTIDHVLDHKPSELSGGQKQRVGLARSIVRPGRVLLLDSPLAHVDTKVRHEMRGRLKDLSRELQCAVLYVTHDYQEALGLGDRIAVIKDGTIQQIVTPRDLYQHPMNLWEARSVGQPEINILSAQLDGSTVQLNERYDVTLSSIMVPARGSYWLGMRPEHIELRTVEAGREDGKIYGQVQLCQWLGTRTIVTVIVEGLPNLVVAAWGRLDLAPGAAVRVDFQWNHAIWFDKESERNISRITEESSYDARSALARQ